MTPENACTDTTAPAPRGARPHLTSWPTGHAAWWSAALSLVAATTAAAAPPATEPPPPEKASVADVVDLAPLDAVGAPCWAELDARRIYFAHASVGRNILDGIEEILRERPSIGLSIVPWREDRGATLDAGEARGPAAGEQRAGGRRGGGSRGNAAGTADRDRDRMQDKDRDQDRDQDRDRDRDRDREHAEGTGRGDDGPPEGGRRIAHAFRSPAIVHGPSGANGSPEAKIESFEKMLRSREGDGVDLAILKLCYADIGRGTDADALFERYATAVERVRRERPELRFVHCTVPLKTAAHGAKAALKRLVGAGENAANARRGRFNELLRKRYAGEVVLDIAEVESHAPDGTATTVEYDGVKWPCLADDYTDDGGHLNRHGRLLVAREMLLALARTCTAAPLPATTAAAGSGGGGESPGRE